jgi:hypothetical protein
LLAALAASEVNGMSAEFWSKVKRGNPTECWPWLGFKERQGYGRFGRNKLAHRVAYMLHYGPPPKGSLICHECDNPSCCNPEHLWAGTNAENMRDKMRKGRYRAGKGNSKLTESQVSEIRKMRGSGSAIGLRYGVDQSTIARIRRGVSWRG